MSSAVIVGRNCSETFAEQKQNLWAFGHLCHLCRIYAFRFRHTRLMHATCGSVRTLTQTTHRTLTTRTYTYTHAHTHTRHAVTAMLTAHTHRANTLCDSLSHTHSLTHSLSLSPLSLSLSLSLSALCSLAQDRNSRNIVHMSLTSSCC